MFPSFLASVLFGSPNETRSSDDPVTKKDTDRGAVNHGGVTSYAFSGMQGWRVSMEDAHMVCKNIPVDGSAASVSGHSLFGVMDGHGGDFTSGYAAKNFVRVFSKQLQWKKYASLSPEDQGDVPGIELLRPALAATFVALDKEIRKHQNKRNDTFLMMTEQMAESNGGESNVKFERSGSTCVVVMVTPSHIICANAGDSRAILRRDGTTLPLSFDHKPSNIPELERINGAGGFVKGKRVDGDLAVSRGLGDFSYKSNESVPVDHQKVIADPEIIVYPREMEKDEYIVLACDGVWDVATNAQCSNFVRQLLDDGEADLGLICEEAMDTCLDRNSRDNMTIAIVGFTGIRMAKGLNQRNVVWQRRTARQAKAFETQAKLAATRAAANVGLHLSTSDEPQKKASFVTAGFSQ